MWNWELELFRAVFNTFRKITTLSYMKNAASSKRQALHDLFGSQRSTAHKHCSRLHLITLQHVKNHADISPAGSSICSSKLGSIQKLHLFFESDSHFAERRWARRHRSPLWTCAAAAWPAGRPACLGAIKEPGPCGQWPPLGCPDWLESHLPNRLAPCHKTTEQHWAKGGARE